MLAESEHQAQQRHQQHPAADANHPRRNSAKSRCAENALRGLGIFCTAGFCGVAAGMVGIGGGVLLVPLLSLVFGFSQHRAQGTSLIALIPPTGLLAFLAYWKAGYVDLHPGLLLIPGVFICGILGGMIARRLHAGRIAQVFAGLMLLLGGWQVLSA